MMQSSKSSSPSRRFLLIWEIKTIASFTTIPTRATTPMNAEKLKFIPININPGNTPINARGRLNRMMKHCLNELNWRTSVMAIKSTPTSIARSKSPKEPDISS